VSSPWVFATLGFEQVVARYRGAQLGLFGEATFIHIPGDLEGVYGRDRAVSLTVGLHLLGMWMWHPHENGQMEMPGMNM
jgi:hypothetical protein